MGQFSTKIYIPPGSTLSENQQRTARTVDDRSTSDDKIILAAHGAQVFGPGV